MFRREDCLNVSTHVFWPWINGILLHSAIRSRVTRWIFGVRREELSRCHGSWWWNSWHDLTTWVKRGLKCISSHQKKVEPFRHSDRLENVLKKRCKSGKQEHFKRPAWWLALNYCRSQCHQHSRLPMAHCLSSAVRNREFFFHLFRQQDFYSFFQMILIFSSSSSGSRWPSWESEINERHTLVFTEAELQRVFRPLFE